MEKNGRGGGFSDLVVPVILGVIATVAVVAVAGQSRLIEIAGVSAVAALAAVIWRGEGRPWVPTLGCLVAVWGLGLLVPILAPPLHVIALVASVATAALLVFSEDAANRWMSLFRVRR